MPAANHLKRDFVNMPKPRFIHKDIYGGRGDDPCAGFDGCFRPRKWLRWIGVPDSQGRMILIGRDRFFGAAKGLVLHITPSFVEAVAGETRMNALTFVANYAADLIDASITRAQQVEYCATGVGFMGSSLEYLKNIYNQIAALDIQDNEVSELLRETEAYLDS